ncbi:MAG TPA: Na+:solute symporter [Propioniciclava sp.]|uniref:sodium:solute symporter family protein n=1 Tax=Propioniciclava sp. TaxID=2038686 RepID=UPI002BDDB54E|nr:sodium:solute symporter family protein [Propioniciclava sp.]HRL50706.1 Na+:solute symporter [Propioniciclava sp.]HRL81256.1 Na+:solute symporter [Propioniciclava sp.]
MGTLDWVVIAGYFLVMVWIGWWSKRRIKNASDFFVAGGKVPWWLVGISHHMSGYSAAVFVGYAALAYTTGFAVYVWWALSITAACVIGTIFFAPRWPRLRQRLGIISPLEYLATRFNVATEQLLAWSGALLKIFDVAAKWTASAILLNVFAGVPMVWGILLVGGVTMFYSTIGGIWADVLTDFGQFVIQFVAAIALAIAVMMRLDGIATPITMWQQLPPDHALPFNGTLTLGFFTAYIVIATLSYNGGTWNLAMRMIATENGRAAQRSLILSGALYLIWPLVLFFPMWAAPLILPDLAQPDQSYALLATQLLPQGLIGLVLAGMFAHTMAMTSSDSNAIASVVVRDIIPQFRKGKSFLPEKSELFFSRLITFLFITFSMIIALTSDSFGGVLGLLILWFGALVGPVAVPMLFGMLPAFRRSGSSAALISTAGGLLMFALNRWAIADWVKTLGDNSQAWTVATPVLVSIVLFVGIGFLKPENTPETDALIDSLSTDLPEDADAEGAAA